MSPPPKRGVRWGQTYRTPLRRGGTKEGQRLRMGVMQLREGVHLVRETEAARFLRRDLDDPDIITFWNTETGKWVVGYWLNKLSGVIDDVEDVGDLFEDGPQLTSSFVSSLRRTRRATDFREYKRKLEEGRRRRFRKYCEELEDLQGKREWVKKKTGDPRGVLYH